MEDITGLGSVGKEIIDALSRTCGTLYEPTRIVREAKARGEALQIQTQAELQADLLKRNAISLVGDANNDESSVLSRAGKRVGTQESKRQLNIERIATDGLAQAQHDSEPRAIDDDWMQAFIQYAQDISADGVRELWSTILSSQATEGAPVVSRATLDAMRLLEPKHALHFERALSLYASVGAILDTKPTDDSEQSFNVNDLMALALEDIGFLRRRNDSETALALRDCTLTFWDSQHLLGREWPDDQSASMEDWCGIETAEQVRSLRHVLSEGTADKARKALRLSSMQLTSRGFELAAVAMPELYAILNSDEAHAHEPALLSFAEPEVRSCIVDEWALEFSQMGTFVVKNQRDKRDSRKLIPTHYFDAAQVGWRAMPSAPVA